MEQLTVEDIIDKIEKRVKVLENHNSFDPRLKELKMLLGWILCDDDYPTSDGVDVSESSGFFTIGDEPTEEQLRIWHEYIEKQRLQNPLFFCYLDEVSKK